MSFHVTNTFIPIYYYTFIFKNLRQTPSNLCLLRMVVDPLPSFYTLMMTSSGLLEIGMVVAMVLEDQEAQVGYDAGDSINYYTVNGSMTPSIVDIETTSNVGTPGMYIFEVDGNYTGMSSVGVRY